MTANPAESHSRPLGSEEKTRGIIQEKNRVDLNKAPFNYGDDRSYSHSAQFLGDQYVAAYVLGETAEGVRLRSD